MKILDGVNFTEVPPPEDAGGLPYATHEGVLEIAGQRLRCYRISDGRAIINADDFHAFFESMGIDPASEVPVSVASSNAPNSALSD